MRMGKCWFAPEGHRHEVTATRLATKFQIQIFNYKQFQKFKCTENIIKL